MGPAEAVPPPPEGARAACKPEGPAEAAPPPPDGARAACKPEGPSEAAPPPPDGARCSGAVSGGRVCPGAKAPPPPTASGGGGGPGARASLAMMRWAGFSDSGPGARASLAMMRWAGFSDGARTRCVGGVAGLVGRPAMSWRRAFGCVRKLYSGRLFGSMSDVCFGSYVSVGFGLCLGTYV